MNKQIISIFLGLALLLPLGSKAFQTSPIDSLTNLLRTYTDTPRVIVLNKLSFQYMLRGQNNTALEYGNQARTLSKELDYMRGHAKSLINIGNVYLGLSDFILAEEYYLKALILASELNDAIVISHCTNNLGEVYRSQGNYEKAIYYYLESLKVAETLGDKAEEVGSLNNIGLVYSEMNNIPKSIEFFKKALAISTSVQNKYDMSTVILNLGRLYDKAGDRKTSRTFYNDALKIKEEIQDQEGIEGAYIGLGNLAMDDHKNDEAIVHYTKALRIAEILDDKLGVSVCLNNIGNIYFLLGNSAKAVEFQKDALKIATEIGAKEEIKNAYFNLAGTYQKLGEYKISLDYLRLYSVMKDSLFATESAKRMAEMQVRYETEKKEKEVEALKKEQSLLLLVNRNQKIMFASMAALIAMIGAAFYFRALANKQKNIVLKEKVDSQNRELTTIALLVTKKNQAFSKLKNELNDLAKNPISTGSIHDLVKTIDHEIDFDEEWNMFKYHFEKVHPDFFNKLKTLAPSLSFNELRLCAYLRANFSTKEIASLTNTTVRSVQQAKYRINQKFQNSAGNLQDYLLKI